MPHAIPLLACEPVADYAFFALRKVAEERIGQLSDALLDPAQEPAVRRGLARVLSVCVSQRAADSLILALEDSRFDVRSQAARSLAAIIEKNPLVRVDREPVYAAVLAEVKLGQDPADQRLSHVFSLLSLVLPREPLQIAYRGLQSNDRRLRGTALEYLEGTLPPHLRAGLLPSAGAPSRPIRLALPSARDRLPRPSPSQPPADAGGCGFLRRDVALPARHRTPGENSHVPNFFLAHSHGAFAPRPRALAVHRRQAR